MAQKKEVKEAKKHVTSKTWKNYSIEGGSIKRNNRSCPKCGSGTFLAKHKNRQSCGKCGYTEFEKKE